MCLTTLGYVEFIYPSGIQFGIRKININYQSRSSNPQLIKHQSIPKLSLSNVYYQPNLLGEKIPIAVSECFWYYNNLNILQNLVSIRAQKTRLRILQYLL